MTDKTLDRLNKAVRQLTFHQPFFGSLLLYMRRIEENAAWNETMAVDGRDLYWNRAYVEKLSDAELQGVLAHEVMHCALLHFARVGDRNMQLWNCATDFAINRDLKAGSFHLPGEPISLASPPGTRGHLYDPQFDGLDAETIYDRLLQHCATVTVTVWLPGDGTDPGGMGSVMKAPGSASQQKEAQADWQIRIRQAATQAARMAGTVPGSVKELIDKLNNPQIDWRARLRAYVGQALRDDTSWSRPNRRFVADGLYMPSRPRDAVERLLFIFDTSGSMSARDELVLAASEAEGILNEGGVNRVQWACVDTRVASHGELTAGETFGSFEVSGRGGTNFDAPMQWAAEQQEVACIVFFTDGCTGSFGADPGIPVLWLAAKRHEEYVKNAPYGEIAYVE